MLTRWSAFVAGGSAFLVAHAIEVLFWTTWVGGQRQPWFLNSGNSIAFTMGCVGVGSAVAAAFVVPKPVSAAIRVAAGACVAMTLVLLLGPGPGNLFPIVLMFGGSLLLVSSAVGAWLGHWLTKMRRG